MILRCSLRLSSRLPTNPWRTTRHSLSTDAATVASRLGLGSHKWVTLDRQAYQDLVHTALANGITTLEVGQEGGDVIMSEVLSTLASQEEELPNVQLLQRVGYRTLPKKKPGTEGDVQVEETPLGTVQHNISPAALKSALYDSYLNHAPSATWQTNRTLLLHNPEVQVSTDDKKPKQRQEQLRALLSESFLYLQAACLEHQVKPHNMRGYGIVSNGLSLPENHPLHLSWTDTVLPALQDVQQQLGIPSLDFTVLQLPVNLLETGGLSVARQVDSDRKSLDILDEQRLQIMAMRPLTCYPDLGTGNGKPFILADYLLPGTMDKTLQWTHTMKQPPQVYQVALKNAMAHFDANEILELKQQGVELSTEQRETLDGCKLMQSLLHDVDQSLEKVRSFAQHEQDLYERIIPLIHDTFEGYDEDTASALQSFFGAYSLAVRYAIAKNTRHVLTHGDQGASAPKYPELSPDVTLQEYALHFLLKSKVMDKMIIGFSESDQILQDMDIVLRFYSANDAESS